MAKQFGCRMKTIVETTRLCAVAAVLAVCAMPYGLAHAADCKDAPAAGIDWSKCDKSNQVLRGGNLTGAILTDTNFTLTDLRDTNLDGADFEKATLIRASLAGSTAAKADFGRVEAYRTSFAGMKADGANFASAELQRADFAGAQLSGVDFQKAELGRANFERATLTGANFSLANLSRAVFQGSVFEGGLDFSHAFMFLTRIEGVDLSQSTGLAQEQMDLACGDANTKLPAGLSAPPSWPCAFE